MKFIIQEVVRTSLDLFKKDQELLAQLLSMLLKEYPGIEIEVKIDAEVSK
jgi:hypothetical protein